MHGLNFLLSMSGAVALLLWGVRMVRTGMTRAFGTMLREALATCVRTPLRGFAGGIFVTGLLQSSTATALLLASFAGAGLIELPQALAVTLGANVGTTLAGQLLSVGLDWLGPLAIAGGTVLFFAAGTDRLRHIGRIGVGLGLMLLALSLIGEAAGPLETSETFQTVIASLREQPILACLLAAGVTWLVHSSLSVVLLVMSLAAVRLVPLDIACAMVLGANLGSAIAPFVEQAHAPVAARRVALGNLLLRMSAASVALAVVPLALPLLLQIEDDPGRLVIDFHTIFNLAAAFLFLPVIAPVARLCERLLPAGPPSLEPGRPPALDPALITAPSEALASAAREALRLGDQVEDMLRRSIMAFERPDQRLVRELRKADEGVDHLYEAIKRYVIAVSRQSLSPDQRRRAFDLLIVATNLEHIGDIIDRNLMSLARRKSRQRSAFSSPGQAELRALHGTVTGNLRLALNLFASGDTALARNLIAGRETIRTIERRATVSHFARLRQGHIDSLESSSIHLDVVGDLCRINAHVMAIAHRLQGDAAPGEVDSVAPAAVRPRTDQYPA